MKKTVCLSLLSLASLISVTTIYAQGAFATFQLGIAMPSAAENINYLDFSNSNSQGSGYVVEQIDVSLGKGMNVGISFGYMFGKHIGAELGISYLKGTEWKAADRYDGGRTDYTLSATMLRFNPSLIIVAGAEGSIKPYARLGCIFGKSTVVYGYHDNDGFDVYEDEFKMYGNLAIGYTAAAGATFAISEKLSFFSELNLISLSYAPGKAEYVVSKYNGEDQLPDMETDEKQFVFEKEYDYDQDQSSSEPSKIPSFRLPFGSIGLNIGLKFVF